MVIQTLKFRTLRGNVVPRAGDTGRIARVEMFETSLM